MGNLKSTSCWCRRRHLHNHSVHFSNTAGHQHHECISKPEKQALKSCVFGQRPTKLITMIRKLPHQHDLISQLPKELAFHLFSFLGAQDLLQVAKTSQHWNLLCGDYSLWRQKCLEARIEHLLNDDGDAKYLNEANSHNWQFKDIEPEVLEGFDDDGVGCLELCGDHFVTRSMENNLKIWSAITGKCLRTLVGHTGRVSCIQMTNDTIISGSKDGTLILWSMVTGECLHTLSAHTNGIHCMALHDRKVVSGSWDNTLHLWDINTGNHLQMMIGHSSIVSHLQYRANLIISGSLDCLIMVWDPFTGDCLQTLRGHTKGIDSLLFNGTLIVSGSYDKSMRVWDVETGECLRSLEAFQPRDSTRMQLQGNLLVTSTEDFTFKFWDITINECLQTIQGENNINCLRFNGKFLITGSSSGQVKLWDLTTRHFIRDLVTLESGAADDLDRGVEWEICHSATKLVCTAYNYPKQPKLMLLNFNM